ncbi:MAG: hypothetical protein KDC79_12740 [Cyclobacteriaceae bacterium]|nr:hypothetical protein [Cyclobacteriaceae bacterium]
MKKQQNNNTLEEVVSLTTKDLGVAIAMPPDFDEFVKELSKAIQYLIDTDFERLMQILYRIDVDENKVKLAFGLENNVADELALLVIEREKQKVLTRAKYR